MGIDNIIHITNVTIRDTFGGYRTGKIPGKCFGNMAASPFGNSADARHNSWETSIRCHSRFYSDNPANKLLAFRVAIDYVVDFVSYRRVRNTGCVHSRDAERLDWI